MASMLYRASRAIRRHRGLIVPVAAAALVLVILVPLPPGVIDMLLAANIALAAVVLLTTIYVASPLEFSVFPSVLLMATLLRLVLNVATTRLILTAGAGGRTAEEAALAAGQVIWSFSRFVTSGSLAVGVILFVIILVIQFVVITRGASRISEVAARFMLDAMPGKQLAINADLSASQITEAQARHRRGEIAREADFYGAMDGASKFVRGDAVAALIITVVNILGGLYIGLAQYGWTWARTLDLFSRLTIGDGLATQVPAFIVSISAALMVSRSTVRTNLGEEVVGQLTSKPVALGITAAFLGALLLTSLPKLPLLLLGAGLAGLAAMLSRRDARRPAGPHDASDPASAGGEPGARPATLGGVDPVRIELGYNLVELVDPDQGGDLVERIAALREQVAQDLGFLVPPVRIRDDLHLASHAYVVRVRGAKVGSGKLYPKRLLAVAGEDPAGTLSGQETVEPTFGTPAVWIRPDQRARAEMLNYAVVHPPGVLMTHLAEIVRQNAGDLLSRQQVVGMLARLGTEHGALVEEVCEKIGAGKIRRLLQNLLAEGVSVCDLETILEAVSAAGEEARDLGSLTAAARAALGRGLSQEYCGEDGKLWCVCLDAGAEETLGAYLASTGKGMALAVGPDLARKVSRDVSDALGCLRRQGRRPVVLCTPQLRAPLRNLICPAQPDAAVLGYNEVGSVEVETVARVGIET